MVSSAPFFVVLAWLSAALFEISVVVDGFGNHASGRTRCRRRASAADAASVARGLVTEDDVLEAVEQAESLWGEALEARKTANALSDRAEEEAEAAASVSKEVEEMVNTRTTISMEQLAQTDAAASANLDASSALNRALIANERADQLELQAEEALKASEKRLEEHLKDFPDSPLALPPTEGENDEGDEDE